MSDRAIPELLAPVGNVAMLHAAVRAGADAVYLGTPEFNARRNAENFSDEDFARAVRYCHLRGVAVYVTMNTLILDDEMARACKSVRKCIQAGADAFIVQDIGFLTNIVREFPGVRVHASTQMSIHSVDGVRACVDLGVRRITLARELSLPEIACICDEAHALGVEIEVFGHGAICVCYSGQCLMSSMIGARSANRGLCAQACRLAYELKDEDSDRVIKTDGEHLLSPRDLCTIDDLDGLINAGVDSLKIEGRMKSPEYVYTVVSTYREALDRAAPKDAYARLQSVFSRGFTSGYLHGERDKEIMAYKRPNNRGESIGRVKSISDEMLSISCDRALSEGDVLEVWTSHGNATLRVESGFTQNAKGAHISLTQPLSGVHAGDRIFRVRSADAAYVDDAREPRIHIEGKAYLAIDRPMEMEFWLSDHPYIRVSVNGDVVESARTKAVSLDEVEAHIDRLGQTDFTLDSIVIELDEGVGIGFSKLHHLRARALEKLEQRIIEAYEESHFGSSRSGASKGTSTLKSRSSRTCESDLQIAVATTNPECARAAKRAGANIIYVNALNFERGCAQMEGRSCTEIANAGYPKHSILDLPQIIRSNDADIVDVWEHVGESSTICVSSIGALYRSVDMGCDVHVGSAFGTLNHDTIDTLEAFGAKLIWLSVELNFDQIEKLGRKSHDSILGVKVIGAQELMVTEHCILMSEGPCAQNCISCRRRHRRHAIVDKKGYAFPIVTDVLGRCHVYNSVQLDVAHDIADLARVGISAFMVDATLMNPEQTAQAVGRVRRAIELAQNGESIEKVSKTTSGHLHRGIR